MLALINCLKKSVAVKIIALLGFAFITCDYGWANAAIPQKLDKSLGNRDVEFALVMASSVMKDGIDRANDETRKLHQSAIAQRKLLNQKDESLKAKTIEIQALKKQNKLSRAKEIKIQKQIEKSEAENARLRLALNKKEAQIIDFVKKSDPIFAKVLSEFEDGIRAYVDSQDPDLKIAIEKYSKGDVEQLLELERITYLNIEARGKISKAMNLKSAQELAALVLSMDDARLRGVKTSKGPVTARQIFDKWREITTLLPDNFYALSQLRNFSYLVGEDEVQDLSVKTMYELAKTDDERLDALLYCSIQRSESGYKCDKNLKPEDYRTERLNILREGSAKSNGNFIDNFLLGSELSYLAGQNLDQISNLSFMQKDYSNELSSAIQNVNEANLIFSELMKTHPNKSTVVYKFNEIQYQLARVKLFNGEQVDLKPILDINLQNMRAKIQLSPDYLPYLVDLNNSLKDYANYYKNRLEFEKLWPLWDEVIANRRRINESDPTNMPNIRSSWYDYTEYGLAALAGGRHDLAIKQFEAAKKIGDRFEKEYSFMNELNNSRLLRSYLRIGNLEKANEVIKRQESKLLRDMEIAKPNDEANKEINYQMLYILNYRANIANLEGNNSQALAYLNQYKNLSMKLEQSNLLSKNDIRLNKVILLLVESQFLIGKGDFASVCKNYNEANRLASENDENKDIDFDDLKLANALTLNLITCYGAITGQEKTTISSRLAKMAKIDKLTDKQKLILEYQNEFLRQIQIIEIKDQTREFTKQSFIANISKIRDLAIKIHLENPTSKLAYIAYSDVFYTTYILSIIDPSLFARTENLENFLEFNKRGGIEYFDMADIYDFYLAGAAQEKLAKK